MSKSLEFPALTAADVECRVQQCTAKGVTLLLYKNARCDMRMLDKAVGSLNWQRTHSRDNANCTVSIWDEDKKQWVSKEDTGTESNTEAEKGLCSDSFKRACTNWGIGRELYTAPFIWVAADKVDLTDTGKKDKYGKAVYRCNSRFDVESMTVEDGRIASLVISAGGGAVFSWRAQAARKAQNEPKAAKNKTTQPQAEKPVQTTPATSETIACAACGKPIAAVNHKGSLYTPEKIAEMTQNTYGRCLCWTCAGKAAKLEREKKGNDNA